MSTPKSSETKKKGKKKGGSSAMIVPPNPLKDLPPQIESTLRGQLRPKREDGAKLRSSDLMKAMVQKGILDSRIQQHGNMKKELDGLFASRSAENMGTSLSSLFDAIMGRVPSTPQVQPNLIDVNSLVAPYAQARDAANSQATSNRARLEELLMRAQADAKMSAGVGRDQAAAAGAQMKEGAANARLQQESDVRAAAAAAAAQGMDPTVVASLGDAGDQAIAATAQNRASGQEYAKAMGSAAELEATRRAQDVADQNRGANTNLDQSLLQAVIALNAQEAQTRTQAEQANAAAMNEASQANAGLARQGLQDRVSLADAIQQMAAQSNAFDTPYRSSVLESLSGDVGIARTAMRGAIETSDTYDEAYAKIASVLEADDRKREAAGLGGRDWDYPWIEAQLQKAYATDQTRLKPGAGDSLLKMFTLGMG
jgi:hypothetical protein